MRHGPIEILPFDREFLFAEREDDLHRAYVRNYLADLGTTTHVIEPFYFDRDYLDEVATFYGTSARGYPNVCRRHHFFAGPVITRAILESALSGDEDAVVGLRSHYLGFIVERPLPHAFLGRTVLAWYGDGGSPKREMAPSREYTTHLVGFDLRVRGLAWQQQDGAVAVCATTAIWSMLHSSAFDDHHAIPTTAEITKRAHTHGSETRVFPATAGLSVAQMCNAISNSGLDPVVHDGGIDAPTAAGEHRAPEMAGVRRFAADRFGSLIAAYVRSGYPVLVNAMMGGEPHTICIVGFRSSVCPSESSGVHIEDSTIEAVYAHDDNIGPGVRFAIERDDTSGTETVALRATRPVSRPSAAPDDALAEYDRLVPYAIVAAVHHDIRVSLDQLLAHSQVLTRRFYATFITTYETMSGVTWSLRVTKVADYLHRDLSTAILTPSLRATTRLALVESVNAMSRHIGVARVGTSEAAFFDALIDTTTSDHAVEFFAVVVYHSIVADVFDLMIANGDFGPTVPIIRAIHPYSVVDVDARGKPRTGRSRPAPRASFSSDRAPRTFLEGGQPWIPVPGLRRPPSVRAAGASASRLSCGSIWRRARSLATTSMPSASVRDASRTSGFVTSTVSSHLAGEPCFSGAVSTALARHANGQRQLERGSSSEVCIPGWSGWFESEIISN